MESVTSSEFGRIHIYAELAALARSLGKAAISPLEQLLIDDIVICWLRLQFVEHLHAQNTNGNIKVAEYWERRLSATHKRYLQSIESLARTRRLLSRARVQINMAGQQVVMNS